MQNTFQLAVGVCCCLKICNFVGNIVVIGVVLGQSFMVISSTGVLLYAKVSPFYILLWECLCCCLQVNYILTGICTLDHQTLLVCKISGLYLLWFLRYWDSN